MNTFPKRVLSWTLLAMLTLVIGLLFLFVGEFFGIKTWTNQSADIAVETREQLVIFQDERSEAVLLFVGDIMLSRVVGTKMETIGDYKYPFLEAANVLENVDLTFGNLEGPISDRGQNQGSIYSFRADPRVVEGLSYAGIDVLSLANNHIWDWGETALLDTISLLARAGITPVGAGANYEQANKPALFEIGKVKMAVLAYTNLLPKNLQAGYETPGLSDFDVDKVVEVVSTLTEEGNLVVILMHWGEEYKTSANNSQKEIARVLIDAGADLIVGHHPHVVQELEQYGDGWVAYSLGNFVFDQSFSEDTMRGVALRVRVNSNGILEAKLMPVSINKNFQPSFVDDLL